MDVLNGFFASMKAGPAWVFYWVIFMGILFMLSIPFSFKNKAARLILVATLILAPTIMAILYTQFGYSRIMGLGHILGWTPILYYLYKHHSLWPAKKSITGIWFQITLLVMLISLTFDVTDVIRFALGARS